MCNPFIYLTSINLFSFSDEWFLNTIIATGFRSPTIFKHPSRVLALYSNTPGVLEDNELLNSLHFFGKRPVLNSNDVHHPYLLFTA